MPSSSEETLFLKAIEIESPQAQLEFLEAACCDQPELLSNVKALLFSYAQSEFLESTPQAVRALRPVNPSAAPLMLGPYRVIEQIARGGMGSVFLADQTEPVRRRVAVKIIRPELDNEDIVRRFQLEQRAHALMDHKNIARVLDASTTESGVSYFVMEYVDGMPIHHYCRQKQLSIPERLLLFLDCAHAIQHAHQKGILHRDIKPSNVLVAEQDGKPLVKVIDFGIAKALQQDDAPNVLLQTMGTRLGEVLGTPQFMSPEQASLGTVSTDTRSDVYSLGALLYQLLTDMPPFETQIQKSMAFDEILRIIRQDDPVRPSQIALKATSSETQTATLSTTKRMWMILKGDLDAIVMKAMEKDPARRYQSAGALIDDVERHLDSRPILARAPSTWYMLGKLAHRRRGMLASIIVAGICLLTGTVAALVQADRARQAELDSRADEQRAIAAEHRTEELLYTAHLKLAMSATENNDPAAALEALSRQIPSGGKADLRSFDWYALARLNRPEARTVFRNPKSLYSMCLVVGTDRIATVGADGIVRVIEPDDGSVVWQTNPSAGELNGVACSPDGKFLSVAGDDGRVIHLHADSGEIHSDFKSHDRQAFQIAWSKDGQFFVTCGNEPSAKIWRFPFIFVRDITAARDLECIAVSSQGDLALGSEGGTIYVVDGSQGFETLPAIQEYVGNERDHCSTVAFSPDGELLASGLLDGTVNLYRNGTSGFLPERTMKASEAVSSLTFSNDQNSLLVGLRDGSLETWPFEERSAQQFSLRISYTVHARSGAALLSNQANGLDWASIHIDPNPGRAAGQPVAEEDRAKFLQVRQVTPSPVDGYFPKGTTKVTIEFSEPIRTDHLSERIHLLRRPDPQDQRKQSFVNPLSTSVDGNNVTFVLNDQAQLDQPTNEVQKFHDRELNAIKPSNNPERLYSVGGDGAVVEFRPAETEQFHIIDQSVSGFDVGYFGVTWRGELPQQFLAWHQVREAGVVTFLPQSEGFVTTSVRQARNAKAIVTYNIRIKDSYMECRLLSNPNDSNHRLLFSPDSAQFDSNALAVSDEAQYVAMAYRPFGNPNQPAVILIKNLRSGESSQVEAELQDIELLFSPDARWLLVSNQHCIQLHQVPSGRLTRQRDVKQLRTCVFSPDGQEILTVGDDGLLQVWSTADLSVITAIGAHDIAARDVDVSPDGQTIATVGFDGLLKFWRRSILEMSTEIKFNSPLEDVEFSSDGTSAAIRNDDGTLYLIDARP
jgi:serine/threonine protein kinase/WD40 repeat protein